MSLLEESLARLELSAELFRGEETGLDQQQLEQLRALGYID